MNFETPLRDEHERLGGQMGVWFGTLLPESYGDIGDEYQRAQTTMGLVDTNFQLVAELSGPDRARYLNAVTSGNIRDLAPGQSAIGLLLNPQGHILAELRTLALDDRLVVMSHQMAAAQTLEALEKYIIMDDVTLLDRTAEFGTLEVVGLEAVAAIEEWTDTPIDQMVEGSHREVRAGELALRAVCASHFGLPGMELLAERQQLKRLWRELLDRIHKRGGGAVGYAALNAARLEAGIPWFGTDFDARVIPHEAGLEQSHISYTKGCYTGQEIVERVRSRGQVNRQRVGLAFSGEALPEAETKLTADSKDAGWVTSAAHSPLAGRVIGMGYLRREFHAIGSQVEWAGGGAEVIALPLTPLRGGGLRG
jgi:folate-binding protein YgfZ